MKATESKWQKCNAALLRYAHTTWQFLRYGQRRGPDDNAVQPDAIAAEPAAPRLNSLERITEYLRRRGLGQQVRVRFEAAGPDFVLEDADGFVHAKDYDEAVMLIERIWLYQP